MLELLAGALLVTVGDGPVVNFFDVGEAVHDERAEQNRIRNFISLDRKTHQAGQSLQLWNLDEAVDVIVLEEQTFQFLEALELRDVRGTNDVVEANILEGDLLNRLLKVEVVQHLQGVSIDEKFIVTFDLSVTGLNETFGAGLFSALVAVKTEALDALHFVLPLLADHLQQALRADVLLLIGIVVIVSVWAGAALRRSIVG